LRFWQLAAQLNGKSRLGFGKSIQFPTSSPECSTPTPTAATMDGQNRTESNCEMAQKLEHGQRRSHRGWSIQHRSSQLGEIGGGGGCGGQEIDDEHCAGKTTDVGNLAGGQKVNCK